MSVSVNIIEWDDKYLSLTDWIHRLAKAIIDTKADSFTIQNEKFVLVNENSSRAKFVHEYQNNIHGYTPKKYPRFIDFDKVRRYLLWRFANNQQSIINDIKKFVITSL